MFHLLAWSEAGIAAGATDADINAVVDDEITTRNNHFILTEPFNALCFTCIETSVTRARLNIPTINAIARHQIFPIHRSSTVPSDFRWQDFRDWPFKLPVNEELAVEATNDLGAATEVSNAFSIIAPPSWNRNLPRGGQRINVRATGALAGVAQSWSGNGALTFAENLRGGWYTVVGAQCFDAGSLAFRLNFARPYMYGGRKLRPGNLCMEAIGNTPPFDYGNGFGVWGSFHSFEPPQFQILANASGASTQEIRLDLIYTGETPGT